jgi:hypothetical protein
MRSGSMGHLGPHRHLQGLHVLLQPNCLKKLITWTCPCYV